MKSNLGKILITLFCTVQLANAQIRAIYGGGAIYNKAETIEELKNSGANTVVVWTMHLTEQGDINFNFEFDLIKNGKYIGDRTHPDFQNNLYKLKEAPSKIDRIEFSIGSWEGKQFEIIKSFYEKDGGFPPKSPIYKNFKKLREEFPMVDAINNDDEFTYDLPSAVAFTRMLASLGFKNTIVPYDKSEHWKNLISAVNKDYPDNIDRSYLQCYAGGSANSPCQSRWDFGILNIAGLWGGKGQMSAPQIKHRMDNWQQECKFDGGFIWLFDNVSGESKSYIDAITEVKKSR